MGAGDVVAAALILAAAVALLVRSLRRTGGGCAGCSQGCRPSARAREPVVQLGGRPRPR